MSRAARSIGLAPIPMVGGAPQLAGAYSLERSLRGFLIAEGGALKPSPRLRKTLSTGYDSLFAPFHVQPANSQKGHPFSR